MKRQFDSCSYEELTRCAHARIKNIREYRRFLNDPFSSMYPHIRTKVIFSIAICKSEIRRLLRYRRILKKSDLKNFDSQYHLLKVNDD